jgi:hypothetical protein
VTLGQRVQRLTGDEFLGNLPLERDAMGTMLGHGFYLQKPDKRGQIYRLKVSTRRGALHYIANAWYIQDPIQCVIANIAWAFFYNGCYRRRSSSASIGLRTLML